MPEGRRGGPVSPAVWIGSERADGRGKAGEETKWRMCLYGTGWYAGARVFLRTRLVLLRLKQVGVFSFFSDCNIASLIAYLKALYI